MNDLVSCNSFWPQDLPAISSCLQDSTTSHFSNPPVLSLTSWLQMPTTFQWLLKLYLGLQSLISNVLFLPPLAKNLTHYTSLPLPPGMKIFSFLSWLMTQPSTQFFSFYAGSQSYDLSIQHLKHHWDLLHSNLHCLVDSPSFLPRLYRISLLMDFLLLISCSAIWPTTTKSSVHSGCLSLHLFT